MGSRRRQEAQELAKHGDDGRIIENAASVRRRLRAEAAVVREDRVLQLYAQGVTVQVIEDTILAEFGVAYRRQVPAMVKRALTRRAEAFAADVEVARSEYVMSQRLIYEAYMPHAIGGQIDPNTGLPMPPDPKMALIAMRAADNIAEVTGAKAPRKPGDVNVNVGIVLPDNPDEARRKLADDISREREKHAVLEGTFRETGGVPNGTQHAADTLPPPKIDFPLGPAPS